MTGKPPAPVQVENVDPIAVEIAPTPATDAAAKGDRDAAVLSTEGQRRINLLWERTQAMIAVVMVAATIAVASFKSVYDALSDPERGVAAGPAFLFLVGASNLVIGFYFGRTNHTKTGGVTEISRRGE